MAHSHHQTSSEPSPSSAPSGDAVRRPTRLTRSRQIYCRRLFPLNGASPLVTTNGKRFAGLRLAQPSPLHRPVTTGSRPTRRWSILPDLLPLLTKLGALRYLRGFESRMGFPTIKPEA